MSSKRHWCQTQAIRRQPAEQLHNNHNYTLTLFVLNFSLDILDGIRRFNLETRRDKTDEPDTFFRPEPRINSAGRRDFHKRFGVRFWTLLVMFKYNCNDILLDRIYMHVSTTLLVTG